MTYKEAIHWIKGFQDNIIREFDFDDKRFGDALKATQIAKEALKKQIPRKPNRSGFTGQYTCRKCGDAIFGLREGIDLYCPHCGQKQDWSNK